MDPDTVPSTTNDTPFVDKFKDVSPLGKQILVMGEIFYLLSHSRHHLGYKVLDLLRFFMIPLKLEQYRIYRTMHQPVGVCVWAYLSPEVAERFATGDYALRKEDWRSGRELWFVELVAPFGEGRRIIDDLLGNAFSDACINYFRQRDQGVRVFKVYGDRHPARSGRARGTPRWNKVIGEAAT